MGTFDMWAGSMFLLEEFRPKSSPHHGSNLSSVTAKALTLEKEKCKKDEERRNKQINYGYATKEYQYYINTVPKKNRKRADPHTPDKNCADAISRRRWDGKIKTWRRALHAWYDAHSHPSTSTCSVTSISSVSHDRSDTGLSDKDRDDIQGANSPIDYLTAQAMFSGLSLDEKFKSDDTCEPSRQGKELPNLVSPPAVPNGNLSNADVFANLYYQMVLQQNLILGWLLNHSSSPQFSAVCELLQQFFSQQALVLNWLGQNQNVPRRT